MARQWTTRVVVAVFLLYVPKHHCLIDLQPENTIRAKKSKEKSSSRKRIEKNAAQGDKNILTIITCCWVNSFKTIMFPLLATNHRATGDGKRRCSHTIPVVLIAPLFFHATHLEARARDRVTIPMSNYEEFASFPPT